MDNSKEDRSKIYSTEVEKKLAKELEYYTKKIANLLEKDCFFFSVTMYRDVKSDTNIGPIHMCANMPRELVIDILLLNILQMTGEDIERLLKEVKNATTRTN